MSYKLLISPLALEEVNTANIYYENKSAKLGERFLKLVEDAYQKLAANPHYYGCINHKKDLRSIGLKKFPFIIVFQIKNDMVLILSVFNTNRDPGILKRL